VTSPRRNAIDAGRRLTLVVVGVFATASACVHGRGGGLPDLDVVVPDSFVVRFETSRGAFDVMARKAWAPNGVDRLYTLVRDRYYDGARFFAW